MTTKSTTSASDAARRKGYREKAFLAILTGLAMKNNIASEQAYRSIAINARDAARAAADALMALTEEE